MPNTYVPGRIKLNLQFRFSKIKFRPVEPICLMDISAYMLYLPIHTVRFFSDYDCDSSCGNKWVVQDLIEVFTLWNYDSITNSFVAHCKIKSHS